LERYLSKYREGAPNSDAIVANPLKADSGPPIKREYVSDFKVGTDALAHGNNVANDVSGYLSVFHDFSPSKWVGAEAPVN
jgi:hypothetical protein